MGLDVILEEMKMSEVYSASITHNLNTMAEAAGIYMHLWRPDQIGITKAGELVAPLKEGLALLLKHPNKFREFEPENGWGSYKTLVEFVENYLHECMEHQDAIVKVCR